LRGDEKPTAFGSEVSTEQIYRALTLIILSMALIFVIVFVLSITENKPFTSLLFETISAFGTVGLSTGITPQLTVAGRVLIIIMMFIGRVGPLTLIMSLTQRQHPTDFRYPRGVVRIG
jgi:trk system potassium uptake protein TrkH